MRGITDDDSSRLLLLAGGDLSQGSLRDPRGAEGGGEKIYICKIIKID